MDTGPDEFVEHIRALSSYDFEQYVGSIFEALGWDVSVTSESADRGIDLVARKEPEFEELIQVKRYGEESTVSSAEVRKYATLYQQEDVDSVAIVTASSFTRPALTLSRDLNVRTIDSRRLYELADRTDSFEVLQSGRFDVDEETLRRSSPSSDEAFVPESFVDVSAEYQAALDRSSTLLNQTPEVIEASNVIVTFAQQGGRRNLKDTIATYEDLVSLVDGYYDTADAFRDISVHKLPSDYRDYHQRRIGVIETIADRLLRMTQYQEALVSARLPTGEGLSADSTLDADSVKITPVADSEDENLTISKMTDDLERTVDSILRLKRISDQGSRILDQHEQEVRNS